MKLRRGNVTIAVEPDPTSEPGPPSNELQALVKHYHAFYAGNVEVIDWPGEIHWRARAERVRRAIGTCGLTDIVAPMVHHHRVYLSRVVEG